MLAGGAEAGHAVWWSGGAVVALRGAAAHAVRGDAMGWRLAMRSRRRALLGVAKRKLGAAVYAMGAGTGL